MIASGGVRLCRCREETTPAPSMGSRDIERTMPPVQLPEGALGDACMIPAGVALGLLLRILPLQI